MMRPAPVVVALAAGLLAACFQDHPADAVQTSATEGCATCHLDEYEAESARVPTHGTFPRRCDDCHHTSAWHPALEGLHPEAAFPIARGDHDGIACQRCHDLNRGRSADGVNTVCTSCHERGDADDEHDEVRGYAWSATDAAFCLRCHPAGRGDD
jgi:hypothetical protein